MSGRKQRRISRFRVGKVSVYLHHGAWWLYYREGGNPVRRKIGPSRQDAEKVAAQVNAQLTTGSPSMLSFCPIGVADLRRQFLDYHEHVLRSSMGTVRRYKAATQHLENFVCLKPGLQNAHEIRPLPFASYLREIDIAPNGHRNTVRRKLRDRGIQYILETCRSMYHFALKRRHLPPYVGNPFSELPLDRLKIEDAKPIFVFNANTEMAYFRAASAWAFPIHFTLAKTGMRIGELVHVLIEDVDLEHGWLHIRNKTKLGWRVKTGNERIVPLIPELVGLLRAVIGTRPAGPVFLREMLLASAPVLIGDRGVLERACQQRQDLLVASKGRMTRSEALIIARGVWRDAGAIKADAIRNSFVRIMCVIGHAEATCPKSWRHTFATLLQDCNIDPLIRQQVMGHKPSGVGGLGMTANYTHTRPETMKEQVERALRRWPQSLQYAAERSSEV